MRICPMCSNEASDETANCICGYQFQNSTTESARRPRAKPEITSWGWALLVAGLVAAIGSQFMATAVPSYSSYGSDGVHNIGLMQSQMMVFQAGLCAALSGIVLLAASAIIQQSNKQ